MEGVLITINDNNNNNNNNNGTIGAVVVRVVRYSMTLLLVLFLAAAILSIRSTQQYSFIVIVIWILLLFLFIAFCYMIDETILHVNTHDPTRRRQRRRNVFHPLIHTVHDYIITGMTNFVEDCRTEYHFLHTMITYTADTNDPDMASTTTAPPQRTKTRFFRMIVQPVLHFHWRRHRKRPTPSSSSTKDDNTTTTTTTATGTFEFDRTGTSTHSNQYIPPKI